MAKPGRPPHEATDERRAMVGALKAFGVPDVEIAKYIGIHIETLMKHYRAELDHSALERNAKVAGFLYHAASGKALADGASYSDCLRSAMFWAKTRMGWRETNHLDHTSSDGSMTPKGLDASKLSEAALAELMNARRTEDQ